MSFDVAAIREQFPILKRRIDGNPLIYLDNAATTQKPQCVIDALVDYYSTCNSNVHRGAHRLADEATGRFEAARDLVKDFINAPKREEVIWTTGTTEGINIVANGLSQLLSTGDEVIATGMEHHANLVTWQQACKVAGAILKIVPVTEDGELDQAAYDALLNERTKFVAFTHVSNALGTVNPIKEMTAKAKVFGAWVLVDGAQGAAHRKVDVQDIGCDFYVFSAHKMYGPTGVGLLYGKEDILEAMTPYQGGGEMIKQVSFVKPTTFNVLPFKFEAGTPNIAGVIGFGKAAYFIQPYLRDTLNKYANYEKELSNYCYQVLGEINEVNFITLGAPDIGVIAFTVSGHHNHDIATALDSLGVAIRTGHHCAMPLMESLQLSGCLRVSLAAYNTFEEIDYFIHCLRKIVIEQVHDDLEGIPAIEVINIQATHCNNAVSEIKEKFTLAKSWDAKHREIMLMGKQLERLDKQLRNNESLISGCESQAWLIGDKNTQGLFTFSADSDAKIIRGLLVIVLAAFNHKNKSQINELAIEGYFSELGLMQHLSPSRGNGLLAIVDKIKQIAINEI